MTICCDFGAQENSLSLLTLFPLSLPWSDGTGSHDLGFLKAEYQASFFTLFFHIHQEAQQFLFTFAICVVSSANLRLLMFLLAIPNPACASSNPGFCLIYSAYKLEKAMAPHSSTPAWKIPWTEEPGRLLSIGSGRVGHHWATSLSLFTFKHWRRKWQPPPVFLPGESQGRGSLGGCHLRGHTESDTTEAS